MNLFERLVAEAMRNQPDLSPLKMVVEKELLHHDILRILSEYDFLKNLTFIGGTCLRCCYGGTRLSEDLDFTGDTTFTRDSLATMSDTLIKTLYNKYEFNVTVSEPVIDKSNVDTWKIKIKTRPEQKHLPEQHIHLAICSVPSYEKQPMMLLNPYGIDMGTNGLILQVQRREEIYADKLLAFALRPNRIKYRDLWDILWLHQQGFKPKIILIPYKLNDRNFTIEYFMRLFHERIEMMTSDQNKLMLEFKKEMQRFLPPAQTKKTLEQHEIWKFIIYLMKDFYRQMNAELQ